LPNPRYTYCGTHIVHLDMITSTYIHRRDNNSLTSDIFSSCWLNIWLCIHHLYNTMHMMSDWIKWQYGYWWLLADHCCKLIISSVKYTWIKFNHHPECLSVCICLSLQQLFLDIQVYNVNCIHLDILQYLNGSAMLSQLIGEGRSAIQISLAPHVVLLMPLRWWKHRKKAACKSPNHLVSSAWCLWIVHECDFRL